MEAEHEFTLILEGVPDLTREVVDALYESGCDDGTPSRSAGVLRVSFTRSAPSREEAIATAIRDVHRAGIGARATVEAGDGP